MIESPCVKLCRLDAQDTCVGCRRTLDEIARWETMADAERRAVLSRVRAEAPRYAALTRP